MSSEKQHNGRNDRLRSAAAGLFYRIRNERFGAKNISALRKIDKNNSANVPSIAYKLLAEYVDDDISAHNIEKWLLMLKIYAIFATGQVARMGDALYKSSYTERRLAQLLSTTESGMFDALPRMARYVSAHNYAIRPEDIMYFVLYNSQEGAIRISRDYFRNSQSLTTGESNV